MRGLGRRFRRGARKTPNFVCYDCGEDFGARIESIILPEGSSRYGYCDICGQENIVFDARKVFNLSNSDIKYLKAHIEILPVEDSVGDWDVI